MVKPTAGWVDLGVINLVSPMKKVILTFKFADQLQKLSKTTGTPSRKECELLAKYFGPEFLSHINASDGFFLLLFS